MIDLTAGVYVPFSVTVSVKRMILLLFTKSKG